MPVERIEKFVAGAVVQRAERNRAGLFVCHPVGMNMKGLEFSTLDDVGGLPAPQSRSRWADESALVKNLLPHPR